MTTYPKPLIFCEINYQGRSDMWSKELTELSISAFEHGFCHVKSESCQFGFLEVYDHEPKYGIRLNDSDTVLQFNSVNELIEAGWAVD